MSLKECGACNKCCSGVLVGSAYGNPFNPSKPCIFLVENKCCIYATRPETCRTYQCAWSQNLFNGLRRPDQSNILVSVENKDGKQLLRCTKLGDTDKAEVAYLNKWALTNKTICIWVN